MTWPSHTIVALFHLDILVYQPVLPRGLASDISNNYRFHTLFNQLNILIRYIHIYYYIIVINVIGLVTNIFFSLCITHPYVFDMYSIEHFV